MVVVEPLQNRDSVSVRHIFHFTYKHLKLLHDSFLHLVCLVYTLGRTLESISNLLN